mmetsp:Transcript_20913/g.48311  ORF Transcript_20913/g.48311 Transcript_20913/m.48311 type:complete len:305 (+) Transcript_20913:652-1566(+)
MALSCSPGGVYRGTCCGSLTQAFTIPRPMRPPSHLPHAYTSPAVVTAILMSTPALICITLRPFSTKLIILIGCIWDSLLPSPSAPVFPDPILYKPPCSSKTRLWRCPALAPTIVIPVRESISFGMHWSLESSNERFAIKSRCAARSACSSRFCGGGGAAANCIGGRGGPSPSSLSRTTWTTWTTGSASYSNGVKGRPNTPKCPSPNENASPSSVTQIVCLFPQLTVATHSSSRPPCVICLGLSWGRLSPCPNCPQNPSPQVYRSPSSEMAAECNSPADTHTMRVPLKASIYVGRVMSGSCLPSE